MEDHEIQTFVLNQLKNFDEKLSIIESNQLRITTKFDYLDNRLQTLECSFIHMDEKDLKASSEIKSGLNPIRSDIMELKTNIRQVEVLNQARDGEIKKELEKNAKKFKTINKEIEHIAVLATEEKNVREREIADHNKLVF